jgi:hypothetical protein
MPFAPRTLRDRPSSRGAFPSVPAQSRRSRAAARSAGAFLRAATLEQSNFGDDGGAGLLSEEGLYAEGEGALSARLARSGGGGGGKRAASHKAGASLLAAAAAAAGGGGGGSAGLKRGASGPAPSAGGAAAPAPPWARPNKLRRLPEVLAVGLGAATEGSGDGARPLAPVAGLPHASAALRALAAAREAATVAGSGGGGGAPAAPSGPPADPAAALVSAEGAARFLAVAAPPSAYPPRRFCAACGAAARYSVAAGGGGCAHVCSLACRNSLKDAAR